MNLTLLLLALQCWNGTNDRQGILISEPLFRITDASIFKGEIALLDADSKAIGVLDEKHQMISTRNTVGQGPGELNMPRAILLSSDRVYVGDLGKMIVYDKNLKFVADFRLPNNPNDIVLHNNQLYISVTTFPLTDYAISIYDLNGKKIRELYKHGLKDNLAMPFFTKDGEGGFYIQPLVRFSCDHMFGNNGKTLAMNQAQPIQYKPIGPIEPFIKKFGPHRATYLQWRKTWSMPVCLALLDNGELIQCFENLEEDMVTRTFFIQVSNPRIPEAKSRIIWKPVPGALVCASNRAYFSEVHTDPNTQEDLLYLKGYLPGEL